MPQCYTFFKQKQPCTVHEADMDQTVFSLENNGTAKNHNSAESPSHEWMAVQAMYCQDSAASLHYYSL